MPKFNNSHGVANDLVLHAFSPRVLCLRSLHGMSDSFVLGRSLGLSPYDMNNDEQFPAVILYVIAHTEIPTSREASDFTDLLL